MNFKDMQYLESSFMRMASKLDCSVNHIIMMLEEYDVISEKDARDLYHYFSWDEGDGRQC